MDRKEPVEKKLHIEVQEYDFITDGENKRILCDGEDIQKETQNARLIYESPFELVLKVVEGDGKDSEKCRFKLKEPLFEGIPDEDKDDEWKKFARFLGLHAEFNKDEKPILKAHWFVGITRLPVEEGEIIVQVKPKIENLDLMEMFMEVLSHPIVSAHFRIGDAFHIDIDEEPIEMEEVPREYLLFLALQYMYVLNNLVKRGLQRGYRRKEENLRGRVRGRILVGRTVRENWSRGRKHYVYSSFMEYSADNLENRILKAAFLKARSYLFHNNIIHDTLAAWIGRISLDMEQVATTRIYPSDFSLTNVQRIRRDYDDALKLAKIILRHLGYDPTVKTDIEKSLKKVHPYWIDMNELFERYVEVELRKKEIEYFKDWQVFPGYGRGEGTSTDVGELRPDFVLVKGCEIAIGDAKYKDEYQKQNRWIREDLQQIALYGRIKKDIIENWLRDKRNWVGVFHYMEPKLYIFYPCPGKSNGCSEKPVESGVFRGIYKVGVKVPLKGEGDR